MIERGPAPTRSQARCATCGRTFGGVTGFDRHRRNGSCLDPASLGMARDRRGVWRAGLGLRPTFWAADGRSGSNVGVSEGAAKNGALRSSQKGSGD